MDKSHYMHQIISIKSTMKQAASYEYFGEAKIVFSHTSGMAPDLKPLDYRDIV